MAPITINGVEFNECQKKYILEVIERIEKIQHSTGTTVIVLKDVFFTREQHKVVTDIFSHTLDLYGGDFKIGFVSNGQSRDTAQELVVIMDTNSDKIFKIAKELLKTVKNETTSVEKQCIFCKKFKEGCSKCGKCKKIHYCSVECQKADWKEHKKTCCA